MERERERERERNRERDREANREIDNSRIDCLINSYWQIKVVSSIVLLETTLAAKE